MIYFLWHVADIAQFEQPQPHVDFPFFLSFIIFRIISATTAIRIKDMKIVAKFALNHESILMLLSVYINLFGKFCRLLIRANKHINHKSEKNKRTYKADYAYVSCE